MKQYHDLMRHVRDNGTFKGDRTGTGTVSTFGHQMRFNLAEGFPLVTTKKVHIKSIIHELLFFIRGETNQQSMLDEGVSIWKEWGDANGNLGPIYSHQWRNFGGKHQNRPQPKPADAPTQGDYTKGHPVLDRLLIVWKGMVARCYNASNDNFSYYGGRGVYVCDRWLTFTNFAEDVQALAGWDDKVSDWDNFQLDKDIYGDGFRYSPDTCVWISRSDNQRGKRRLVYRLAHDDGRVITMQYHTEFCAEHGIAQGNFSAMLRGERARAGGWRLLEVVDPDAGVDQLKWVMEEIKRNPDSRRLIVSAWNPTDIPHMALPPCHALFQFYVADGKLSCQLYQRSADIFLGVPFNIPSYALLTHMMAQQAGLEVGEFIWTGGDCHLYSNHLEQADLQLSREPRALPQLIIKRRPESIFDYQFEDFDIVGYDPHPGIKATVAV